MVATPLNVIADLITHDPNPALLHAPAPTDLGRKILSSCDDKDFLSSVQIDIVHQ
ncbi:hypothetical protein ACVMIH_002374 [Bradyrhizobium sp. USDA 4503]